MPAWLLFIVVWLSEARFASRRRVPAQGLVEYSLVIVFIAIVVIAILTIVGETLCTSWYKYIAQKLININNETWSNCLAPD